MKMRLLLLATTLIYSIFGLSSETAKLNDVISDEWSMRMIQYPSIASENGYTENNHKLDNVSIEAHTNNYKSDKGLLERLNGISIDAMTGQDLINHQLLQWILEERISEFELEHHLLKLNTFSNFAESAIRSIESSPLKNDNDFEVFLQRVDAISLFFEQNISLLRTGLEKGKTQPKIVMEGILGVVSSQIYSDPADSPIYRVVESNEMNFSLEKRELFKQRTKTSIDQIVNKSFSNLKDFLKNEYIPKTRASIGISEIPGGKEYYVSRIKKYVTTSEFGPEKIHEIGLSEVARILSEMESLKSTIGFKGDLSAFRHFLRTDKQFYAASEEELLSAATTITNRINYELPGYFGKLPRLPYSVQPVPKAIAPNYTTAAYWPANIGASKSARYVLNTYNLPQRPLYELTALSLHEAVPGHHLQNALSQELENVPAFRRKLYFSAFGEGWALYTEKLGVEMGVYADSYEDFGRLSYEMWRACRLVIDTGIHAKGWSREKAIQFMTDHTSLSVHNIRAEIDRYISWPAQALSYKMGELKIWELRRRAENMMGDEFDLAEFHDLVLSNGALTMDMLDGVTEAYIQSNK